MTEETDDHDDVVARLDRLEATLDELRAAIEADDRLDDPSDPAWRTTPTGAETALRFTERLVVPAAVAALEANVRTLEFVQDQLRELDRRQPAEGRPVRGEVSERVLDRLDDALGRMEETIATADLPRDAEARRLLERARDLNADVRGRVRDPGTGMRAGTGPSGPDVVRIDVEEELEGIREEVDAEATEEDEDAGTARTDDEADDGPV